MKKDQYYRERMQERKHNREHRTITYIANSLRPFEEQVREEFRRQAKLMLENLEIEAKKK